MKRYVETEDLLAEIPRQEREAIRRWLDSQPTAPHLVGATRAAAILGVQPPHIAALRQRGRMPDPIPVEGSVDVYLHEEIVALAQQLGAEREARARRKREREGATR